MKKRKARNKTRAKKISIKKILSPVDFSKESMKALSTAAELSKHFHAELLIVNVVPPVTTIVEETDYSFYSFDVPMYQDTLLRAAKKRLRTTISQKVSRGVKARSIVLPGDPAQTIVKTAKKQHVDLIIIATHGRSGWTHLVFGSVAEKVIRLAPCPVLVVKTRNR
jgi:nucleotide-binding universal stress UspA family protein